MKRSIILAFAFLFCLVSLGHAAGVIALPKTGQDTCYDAAGLVLGCAGTGQDGDIQAGVAWPTPRFTDNHDGTVTDNLTGLMWWKDISTAVDAATCDPGGTWPWFAWQDALDYVKCVNGMGHPYADWRIPNVNELESLLNAGQSDGTSWLNAQGFANMQSYMTLPWSSTTDSYDKSFAWYVDMTQGFVSYDHKYQYYNIWPVRAGNGSVWKTGQTICYDTAGTVVSCTGTGQDGETQTGAAWPSPRFNVVNTYCVIDNLTGLMWPKDADPNGTAVMWSAAINYAKTLTLCGYSDWRLPNRKELFSLIDRSQASLPLPAGHPFADVQPFSYWSSTTEVFDVPYLWAWIFQFADPWDSATDANNKTTLNYVWPVRTDDGSPGIFSLTVTKAGAGSGTVTSSPAGINCGSTCGASFNGGSVITLTAVASPGFSFAGWSGACTGTGTCQVTMNSNATVTATFTVPPPVTPIKLRSFTAVSAGTYVVLQWQTYWEVDNAGFYLSRAEAAQGPYTRINAQIVPAKGSVLRGANYARADVKIKRGKTYFYKLEDIDTKEKATAHGPISVKIR